MIQMKGAPECILKLCDLNDEVRQAELILDSNIYDINLIEPVIEQKYQLYRNINECLPALNLCQKTKTKKISYDKYVSSGRRSTKSTQKYNTITRSSQRYNTCNKYNTYNNNNDNHIHIII
eukprot:321065_1